MGSPLVALSEALGLMWMIVAIAYILMWRDPETNTKMAFGIRTLVIITLPVVLFESMFTLNLMTIEWGLGEWALNEASAYSVLDPYIA
jgi:hypothetical protein